jgi:hypothetical protein|mmetsp:Transcript_12995/g.43029  ORF Transcript_12995/g.43029 Transcript_12995/m.43029 type:complete len:749 (+) Transcript_12995:229-2475(+)
MFAATAAPFAPMARFTPVRPTPSRRVAPGSWRDQFAPKAIPALPKRERRARVVAAQGGRVVAIDAIPRKHTIAGRAVPLRRSVVAQATAVGDGSKGESSSDGQSALTAALVAAAVLAAALAFAYGDVEPLVGAVTAEKLAPAQDATRAAFVALKSGSAVAGDAAVEFALDVYDAALLLAVKTQDSLANLGSSIRGGLSSATGAAGSNSNPLLNPETPLGSFLLKIVAGAAYFADAAANGQWAKILCYKPFKTVAAVSLTMLRIVVSWFLSGAEFACSMLYATPAYAAAAAIVLLIGVHKVVTTVSKKNTVVGAATATAKRVESTQPAAVESSASFVTRADKIDPTSRARVDPPAVVTAESPPKSSMPATAVFEASSRVMSAEEKAVMMRRVAEAKTTIRSISSFATSETTNSYDERESSRDVKSNASSYGAAFKVDQSDVDRIYNELTSKYGTSGGGGSSSSSSSSYSSSYGEYDKYGSSSDVALPNSLPTTTKSSTFDADAFLAAFATDDSSSRSFVSKAASLSSTYATSTTEESTLNSVTSSAVTQTSTWKVAAVTSEATVAATATSTATPKPVASTATAASGSSSVQVEQISTTTQRESKVSSGSASRNSLDFSKVKLKPVGYKVGGLFAKAVRQTFTAAGPKAKDAWRETVALTKVVVPSVPKLVSGSLNVLGNGKASEVKLNGKISSTEVSAAVAASETVTTETTVVETVVTVEEIAEASASFTSSSSSSNEETGTVWKKKKK